MKRARSNVLAERSHSLWMDKAPIQFPTLDKRMSTDVVIIGSGVAGLSTAYELNKKGKKVVVLDRGDVARGISSRTTAHLTFAFDDTYSELISVRGEEDARNCYRSQLAAIDRIEEIVKAEEIRCDFRRLTGILFAPNEDNEKTINDEIEACKTVGFRGVERIRQVPVAGPMARAMCFPNQACFHPTKYLDALAEALARKGVQIFAHSPVWQLSESDGHVRVTAEEGSVEADCAVVATNSPIVDRAIIHSKQAPYRSYAFAADVKRGAIPDYLYWDTLEPYHYVRLQPGKGEHDHLIVGGEDHKTGEADDAEERFKKLERWAREYFPAIKKLTHRWSGQLMDPVDMLPYIGLNPGNERIYIATGDSGQGWTNGTLAGLILSGLIVQGRSQWAELYKPNRITAKAVTTYVSENITAVENFSQYVLPAEVESAAQLKKGMGGLITKGTTKIAAYRDEKGRLHERSGSCTHLGCLVQWNSFERCWDCPCHGSHFSVDGEVLNAPAIAPLAPVESKRAAAARRGVKRNGRRRRAAVVKAPRKKATARGRRR